MAIPRPSTSATDGRTPTASNRRSTLDLNQQLYSIFSSFASSSADNTVPMKSVPSLLRTVESEHRQPLLNREEMASLEELCDSAGAGERVSVADIMGILVAMGGPADDGPEVETGAGVGVIVGNAPQDVLVGVTRSSDLPDDKTSTSFANERASTLVLSQSHRKPSGENLSPSVQVIGADSQSLEDNKSGRESTGGITFANSSSSNRKESLPEGEAQNYATLRASSSSNSMSRSATQPSLSSIPTTSSLASSHSASADLRVSPLDSQSSTTRPILPHKSASSALSYRQRSSPLEPTAPPKPLTPSTPTRTPFFKTSARISRPLPPAKLRRTSEGLSLPRSPSVEPSSPTSPNQGISASISIAGRSDSLVDHLSRGSATPESGGERFSRSDSSTSDLSSGRRSSTSSVSSDSPYAARITSSPTSGVDTTSYHNQPISPFGDVGALLNTSKHEPLSSAYGTPSSSNQFFDYLNNTPQSSPVKGGDGSPSASLMRRERSKSSAGSFEGGVRPDSMFLGEGTGSIGGMRPDSMLGFGGSGRPSSMLGGTDVYIQSLQNQNHDLVKRLKEAEGRLQSSSYSYEQEHNDLQIQLEEARQDLQNKRREEKELRGSEKQHLGQISSLENDIAKLTQNLEKSRELHDAMKKSYLDQCAEAEKLRSLLSEARASTRSAEDTAQTHELQVEQSGRDRELLQSSISRLEGELVIARQAQNILDDQIQENLVLKETIDRLRFDLDDLRAAGRKSLIMDRPGGLSSDGSKDRSLDNELSRSLADSEAADVRSEQGSEEESEDIIVTTTQTRIKKRAARNTPASVDIPSNTLVVVADANTQTDQIQLSTLDTQTDLSAVTSHLVVASTSTTLELVNEEKVKSKSELQEELAKGLGIDWKRLEEFVELEKSPLAGRVVSGNTTPISNINGGVSSRRAGRWASRAAARIPNPALAPALFVNVFPDSAKPYVAQILDSSTSFVLYSCVVFLSGIITGSVVLPLTHHHHLAPFHVLVGASDQAAWHQYNTLGSMWGEGLSSGGGGNGLGSTIAYWVSELVWGGVSVVRRVPV